MKITRLFRNAAYVAMFFLCYLPARILRRMHSNYRALWLVGERGYDARDNGYCFFRYLRKEHPRINAVFVISKDSPDREKAEALGKVVTTGSLQHHLMYLAADYLIGTHVQPAAPRNWTYYRMTRYGIRAKGKQIFLQHGIILNDISHLHYPKLKTDMFVCGAKAEYDHLSSTYGHPDGVMQYLGLCRYDSLSAIVPERKEILLMPTWRSSAYPKGEAFLQTAYYRAYQELLDSESLAGFLEKTDARLIFYPHTEMQRELHRFHASSERIILAHQEQYDVQELLRRCSILITDYSSVFFDAAYMGKPVIFYQFDEAEYRRFLYAEGYFSYERDGFGPVVRSLKELMEALEKSAENGFEQQSPYRERTDKFFPIRDDKNCERTYQAIMALKQKDRR